MAHAVLALGVSRGSVRAACTRAASCRLAAITLRHLTLISGMKSKRKADHLERTASVLRRERMRSRRRWEELEKPDALWGQHLNSVWCQGSPHSLPEGAPEKPSAPSGKGTNLHLMVDFIIPGVKVVGGFSICSSPQLLEQEKIIELAVGVHNMCTLDSEVALRVGRDFFFDPQPRDAPRNLVLIARGVRINPLLSILRHSADLHQDQADKESNHEIGMIKLFYSAKNTSELLFKKNILNLVNECPEKIACSLHVTKQTTQISAELKPYITEGRITEKEIREHISADTLFYICGPPPMTDFFSKQLENSHIPKEHICFEKWW